MMNNTEKIGEIVKNSSMPLTAHSDPIYGGENFLCWATLVLHDMIEPGRKEACAAVAGRECDTCAAGRDLCLMHMLRAADLGVVGDE